ncbi:hypothetical protein DFH07DRAFT_286402 [Mycena maculata]|uniref:Extracellular membrane protein CFEM domain-containing protein n=1 Tax=Mycena maculata TaxID=230809 RepID=A0AAD7MLF2_9AGAR|nr:hypothetical protein DFH07DRAFT_286402 [Mycena maculata]
MLYQFIVYSTLVAIPFSAARPAEARDDTGIDFSKLTSSVTPQQCQSTCSALTSQFSESCLSDLQCVCSDQVGAALSPCVSCIANVANSSLAQTAATFVVDQWSSVCSSNGLPVTTPSITGNAAGASQSAGTGGASGTGSGTGSGGASGAGSGASSAVGSGASAGASIGASGAVSADAVSATGSTSGASSTASGSAAADKAASSGASGSAASASASGKPNNADAPLQGNSVVMTLVGALLAAFFM